MTADEEATGKAPRRSWLRRHWLFTFLFLPFLAASVLNAMHQWDASSGTPVPQWFTVLIYNETAHRIIARGYAGLGKEARRLKSEGAQYTYLLPRHPARYYPYADNDSFVSVKRVSAQEQLITFHYEMDVLSHGWSKYRATDKTIKPVSGEAGGDVYYFLMFPFAIIAWVLVVLVEMATELARLIASRIRNR